ncbi:hypothetical protein AVEN_137664-1, partial [Araneus ventricosus]
YSKEFLSFDMDKYCMHKEIDCTGGKHEYYLFTCSIPNASSINNLCINTENFKMQNGCKYSVTVTGSKDSINLILTSKKGNSLKCSASMFIGSETLLLSKKFNSPTLIEDFTTGIPYSDLYQYGLILSSEVESFQKLKQHPNDALVIICRIKYTYTANTYSTQSVKTPGNTSTGGFQNLKKLTV